MDAKLSPKFMIIPCLACQAECHYCFGPHRGAVMTQQVASKVLEFIGSVVNETKQDRVSITFHGGEPLLAPVKLYEFLLPEIRRKFKGLKLSMHVQSNLWALDDKLVQLFSEHGIKLGTSLDGPREICNRSRGPQYWEHTMQGISLAREHNFTVGSIATITRNNTHNVIEIADFYCQQQLNMNLHPAVSALGHDNSAYALSSEEYTLILHKLFPWYIKNKKNISISTLDNFSKAFINGDPNVCTFKDCFGMFFAIDPIGYIYPCQRFCKNPEFVIGNIADNPSIEELYNHPNALKVIQRQKLVARRCGDCQYYSICKGGCYYNAIAGGDGIIDPLCESYKQTFNFVRQQLLVELSSEDNIKAIAAGQPHDEKHFLFRKGSYISLAGKRHPQQIASTARIILAVYELAKTGNPELSARNLYENGICGSPEYTSLLLQRLSNSINNPGIILNNLYAHVTFQCNLKCKHCYVDASDKQFEMKVELLEKVLKEAADNGFRQFIITGGEPLIHSKIEQVLKICATNRHKGMNIVLRTNLTGNFSDSFLVAIASAFDQVVVSVDGNEASHNARRGEGTYKTLIENIERYKNSVKNQTGAGELSLACVMNSHDINSEAGQSVRILANRLKIKRIRFRPLLPLGRAANMDEQLKYEGVHHYLSAQELLENDFKPLTSCGMGQNLYLEPDGDSFPCYAWHKPHTLLGNIEHLGLSHILASEAFQSLSKCNVDTIDKCKLCEYRYLCGGACRAWGNEENQKKLNAAPPRCDHLRLRAENLIRAARAYLTE